MEPSRTSLQSAKQHNRVYESGEEVTRQQRRKGREILREGEEVVGNVGFQNGIGSVGLVVLEFFLENLLGLREAFLLKERRNVSNYFLVLHL